MTAERGRHSHAVSSERTPPAANPDVKGRAWESPEMEAEKRTAVAR